MDQTLGRLNPRKKVPPSRLNLWPAAGYDPAAMRAFLKIMGMTAAVFLGALAARFAYTYVLLDATGRTMATISERTREQLLEQQKSRHAAARAARSQSSRGRDLERRCEEFAAAFEANGGAFAAEQRALSCNRYEQYLETGRVGR